MPFDLRLNQRRFNQLALLAVVFGFALLVIGFVTTVGTTLTSQRATLAVRHTYQVADQIDQVMLAIDRSETATRGYLLAPDPVRIQTRNDNLARIAPTLDRIAAMTRDNAHQQEAVAELRAMVAAQRATSDSIMAKAVSGRLDAARAEFVSTAKVRRVEQARTIARRMRREEERLLAERENVESSRQTQLVAILAVTGILLLLIGAAAFMLVRRYTIDLTRARDRLNLLNADLEGEVERRSGQLRRANDEIQKFAYIVSHDLRSPLVNVMGFTSELEAANTTIGALVERVEAERPDLITADVRHAREDLPEAIGFIRSSTQKMDRLINAILQLSRQGRRVLTPAPVDMDALIGDIIASLDHRLTEVGATADIEGSLPDIVSDRLALEQIFSNLLDNAVKYLDPERPGHLVVRGRSEGEWLIYEVEDNGRGIDPRDHERVFELFRRAGAQNQPGEGIGLAHVRALVYRLGGMIDCTSQVGQGSTFRLRLPLTYRDKGADN
ncbi:signal transduction histidine kinase [Sphingomonas sp. F9_3S_D5_B_2]